MSQDKFAEKLEAHKQTISRLEREDSIPSSEILLQLHKEFKVSIDWFISGCGAPFDPCKSNNNEYVYISFLEEEFENNTCINIKHNKKVVTFKKKWLHQYNAFPESLSATYMKGDSMEPTLRQGDLLLVDCSKKYPSIDDMHIVHTENGLIVKRSGGLRGSLLTLISDNPSVKKKEIDLSVEYNRIIGRIVWYGRQL